MNSKQIAKRIVPFIEKLRIKQPNTPILLVEDRSYANSFLQPSRQNHHKSSREALRRGFRILQGKGLKRLYYLEGKDLLGNEDTVDSSHPTDLGFERQAKAFQEALAKIKFSL